MLPKFIDGLPSLLDRLYDAALRPERIPDFLTDLSCAFDDGAGVVRLVNRDLTTASYAYGHDPGYDATFAAYYSAINPFTGQHLATMPTGKVMYASDLISEEELVRTEFYNDWMKPQKASPHHCGVAFEKTDAGISILTVSPRVSDFADKRHQYAACLSLLVPHLTRAAETSRLSSVGRAQISQAFEAIGLATLIVTDKGKLETANSAAEVLLRDADPLIRTANGHLHASNHRQDTRFASAIATATRPLHPRPSGPIRLDCVKSAASVVAWILPQQSVTDAKLSLHVPARFATIIVRPIRQPNDIDPDMLRAAFNITAAEARLLASLVAGATLEEHAQSRGLSRNTAKNQLSSLFAKTDTRRQAELIGLALNSLGLLR